MRESVIVNDFYINLCTVIVEQNKFKSEHL